MIEKRAPFYLLAAWCAAIVARLPATAAQDTSYDDPQVAEYGFESTPRARPASIQPSERSSAAPRTQAASNARRPPLPRPSLASPRKGAGAKRATPSKKAVKSARKPARDERRQEEDRHLDADDRRESVLSAWRHPRPGGPETSAAAGAEAPAKTESASTSQRTSLPLKRLDVEPPSSEPAAGEEQSSGTQPPGEPEGTTEAGGSKAPE